MTTSTTAAAPARKATRREWLGLIAIAFPCMIYSMDLTVLNLAVPTLTRELKPSAGELLWIIDIYGFMVAGFQVLVEQGVELPNALAEGDEGDDQ